MSLPASHEARLSGSRDHALYPAAAPGPGGLSWLAGFFLRLSEPALRQRLSRACPEHLA